MRKAVIEVVFDRDHVEEGVPNFLFWHALLACAPHRWFGWGKQQNALLTTIFRVFGKLCNRGSFVARAHNLRKITKFASANERLPRHSETVRATARLRHRAAHHCRA